MRNMGNPRIYGIGIANSSRFRLADAPSVSIFVCAFSLHPQNNSPVNVATRMAFINGKEHVIWHSSGVCFICWHTQDHECVVTLFILLMMHWTELLMSSDMLHK